MANLNPSHCPRCGRRAHFRYLNENEAARMSPLCWGEREEDCPGYAAEDLTATRAEEPR